ncbi:M50 family metallopeptidase [Deinococcus multiflagellatus]|uniref:M50 family metallopeptidase n=1 Tax=Deinococcus multiflagellatus TaxID=1656887 RepID=UPI001CCC5713|nr:M50 family metallopeptidase [Deinococcus multiflagellatus]MBZ9713701.1 M50 family metallopeptidase [Deinococcus multiflagellatus]
MNVLEGIAAALTPLGLLWTLLIISAATFIHELAHYALARWQGVAVQSFSIGMGPVLLRRLWRGTEWRLSLLPIGGYVEIDGMAPEDDGQGGHRQPTRGFAALPAWGKVAVLLAGPLVNLLLAVALMTVNFSAQGVPQPDRARIEEVVAGSRAQALGLQTGDVITAINGRDIPDTAEVGGRTVAGWEGLREVLTRPGPHTFTVERAGQPREVRFDWTPVQGGQRQLLGIRYGPDVAPVGVGTAFVRSWQVTAEAVPQVLRSFAGLFQRFFTLDLSRDENVSGPIGTAEIVSRAAAVSPWALLQVAILLNLSLAFFNLLPIPGLDGGRILLVLVGALRGRPLSFQQEQAINLAGFALVMALMVFVVVRDVTRFF